MDGRSPLVYRWLLEIYYPEAWLVCFLHVGDDSFCVPGALASDVGAWWPRPSVFKSTSFPPALTPLVSVHMLGLI